MLTMNTRFALASVGMTAVLMSSAVQAQSSYKYVALKPTTSTTPGLSETVGVLGLHVNKSGKVAGLAKVKSGTYFNLRALRFEDTYNSLPMVWSTTGVPTALGLGTDKKTSTYAVYGINNLGQVVGATPNPRTVPTLWSNAGKRSVLDTRSGVARAINDAGAVVGGVITSAALENTDRYQAVMWRNGTVTDLHSQLKLDASQYSVATSINSLGAIGVNVDFGKQCLVLSNGVALQLETPNGQRCRVIRVADDGRVYGALIDPLYGLEHPTVWADGQATTLPTQPYPEPFPGSMAKMKAASATGVAVGYDESGPVIWRNGSQALFTAPVSGLPTNTGLKIGSIVGISEDGKLVVGMGPQGLNGWGLLLPQP